MQKFYMIVLFEIQVEFCMQLEYDLSKIAIGTSQIISVNKNNRYFN